MVGRSGYKTHHCLYDSVRAHSKRGVDEGKGSFLTSSELTNLMDESLAVFDGEQSLVHPV